jgi:hypothetical protein
MPLKPEGKIVTVKGTEYRMYPISVLSTRLSEALGANRTSQTIRKWESAGVLPPCIFRLGSKRMYHSAQIDLICHIAKEENIRQGLSLSLTNFSSRVFKEMKELNKLLTTGKYIEPTPKAKAHKKLKRLVKGAVKK